MHAMFPHRPRLHRAAAILRSIVTPKLFLTVLLATALCQGADAQQLEWSVDFNTVFDNREGDNKMTDTRTYFQTQLSPEIGISMLDGAHSLMGGVVWTQPIGSEWYGKRLSPTLYYRYRGTNGWSMAMGMFPRTLMHRQLPNYVWSDSINYTQRNVRGFMATYVGDDGYFEAVVDWRAMQSETRREAFNVIAHGEWQRPDAVFLAGGVVVMNHFAKTRHPGPDQHVVDNFLVNPFVGVDLSRHTALDSLSVRAGALTSITRNREFGKWKMPAGAWLDITLGWRWLAWHNTTYIGGRLFPYYGTFGPLLDQGEPYYRAKWYNQTSVYGTIINNRVVNLRASLDFNVAKDNFTFYQRLILRVYIDSSFKTLPKNYKLKQAFN